LTNNRFLSNIKIFRLWSPEPVDENFVLAYRGWESRFVYNMENTADNVMKPFLSQAPDLITKGRWHLLQFEFKENSAVRAADGVFRVWFNGGLRSSARTDIVSRETYSQLKRPVIVGWSEVWNANVGDSDHAPNDFYMDDIYVDSSWARVEIGDGPTYDACTHREIQIPMSWSDGNILFQVNLGSFQEAESKYLYVRDPDGNTNAQGWLLWLLQAGAPTGAGASDVEEALKPDRKFFSPSVSSSALINFGPDAVRVDVHDVNGKLVWSVSRPAGAIAWDGRDLAGRVVESGVYLCSIEGGSGKVVHSAIAVVK
jgi:hypothetical protein